MHTQTLSVTTQVFPRICFLLLPLFVLSGADESQHNGSLCLRSKPCHESEILKLKKKASDETKTDYNKTVSHIPEIVIETHNIVEKDQQVSLVNEHICHIQDIFLIPTFRIL